MKLTTGRSSRRWALLRQMVLRRGDGIAYLDRLRVVQTPWFAIYLHRFDGPDPGVDLHDHPWPFITIPLVGSYDEVRADIRRPEEQTVERRRPFRPRLMRITECHTIVSLSRPGTRTLVLTGRRQRKWGFYTPDGWLPHDQYEGMERGEQREMWVEEKGR